MKGSKAVGRINSDGVEVCLQWMQGRCRRGKKCKFAHQLVIEQNEKTVQVCRLWVSGKCRRGTKCKYAHVEPDKEGNEGGQILIQSMFEEGSTLNTLFLEKDGGVISFLSVTDLVECGKASKAFNRLCRTYTIQEMLEGTRFEYNVAARHLRIQLGNRVMREVVAYCPDGPAHRPRRRRLFLGKIVSPTRTRSNQADYAR